MLFDKLKEKLYFNPGNRQTVDEDFVQDGVEKIRDEDVEVVLNSEDAINRKFSGANTLSKYAELGKVMLGMLKDLKNGEYKNVPWFTIATIALSLLYVLNPLDVIPDFIPGLGYVDDLAVLSISIGWIESDLHRYLDWKVKKGENS